MKFIQTYNNFLNEILRLSNFAVYTAAFLTDESRTLIQRKIDPKFNNIILHHITIDYMPKSVNINTGQIIELNVIGYVEDDKCQAILIEDDPIFNGKQNPHITYTLNNGVKPFYSNVLIKSAIENDSIIEVKPFKIKCVLGYFNTTNDITK